jgi:DNA-binding Lrp family transcriptional regulator
MFVKGVRAPDSTVSAAVGEIRALINDESPVRFASEFVGAYKAVVAIEVAPGDLAGLQDFLAGSPYNGTTFGWEALDYEVIVEGPSYVDAVGSIRRPKRPGCDMLAFVRISVESGRAREVLGRLGDSLGPVFHGAAIVYGSTDILLTLEATSFEPLVHAILTKLQGIPGVIGTEASFADARRYDVD